MSCTNKSIWKNETSLPAFASLKGNKSVDVLIIGGGMAGLLTAFLLHQKGVDYALVEKGRICEGTTGNTTAKITAQHGLLYHKILKSYGSEFAQMYYRANVFALDSFEKLSREIDCDFEHKENFVYSLNKHKLEAEHMALLKIGCKAKFTDKLPLPIDTAGAVSFDNQAQFNPLKFMSVIAKGLNIYENTFVRQMIGTTAVTDFGKIKAKKVIVCTHFPFINKHGSFFLKLYQHRSYVLALKAAEDINAMYVDDSKDGLSLRGYKDYLLLGGGGHRTGKSGGSWQALREFKDKHFKNAQECFCWAAQDTMSLDSIPYIGQYSKNTPDLYVAAGFNKWGMTSAMVSAEILSALVLGERKEYAPVFNPSRNILKPKLLVNGFETTKNLLTPTAPRCPHLGCALKYNKVEHSWDCVCHGSRFSKDGKVLDNPANGDLKMN